MANALQFSQCSGNYPNPVNVSILPDPPIFGQPVEYGVPYNSKACCKNNKSLV
ncbi:hypothetical protein RhiirB3_434036, partial [Rhizophagus irregularis]